MKIVVAPFVVALPLLIAAGCGESTPAPSAETHESAVKSATSTHDHGGWWCAEHGVPEANCSQCSSKVAADFQKKGDWCDEHDRAKSQCFICDPKARQRYAAQYRAKEGKEPPPIEDETNS